MREHRGQTKDGKWVKGWYFELEDIHYIMPDTASTFTTKIMTEHFVIEGFIEVIPESVGQDTGLKDKKRTEEFPEGQPIFGSLEGTKGGDIVMASSIYGWVSPRTVSEFGLNIRGMSLGELEVVGKAFDIPDLLEKK